jgi:hypothetical protein
MVLFPSKEYLNWKITVFPMFRTQCIPVSLLRITMVSGTLPPRGTKDLASRYSAGTECVQCPHLRAPKLRVTPGSTPHICYITDGV